jgi:drug/metabolite transporter (DMT)-like permease
MYGILALLLANIIWGAGSPIFKVALTNIPPFTLAFFRFFGATLLYLPFVFRYKGIISKKDLVIICLGGFFGITVNITFFFFGLQNSQSINSSIINAAGPLFLFICAVMFFKEKIESKVVAGMIAALLGVVLIIFSPFILDGPAHDLISFEGNLFFILATLGAMIEPLILKPVLKRVSPMVVTFYTFLFGAISFFPFMLAESNKWNMNMLNTDGLHGILYGIIGSTALGYGLMNYGLSKLKLQEVGIFNYAQPVSAILVAMPLLNEYPSIVYMIGSLLIITGIVISEGKFHFHIIVKSIQNKLI